MIFGTYMTDAGAISELEVETSRVMQDYLLAFLKDAATIGSVVGWPAFEADALGGGVIVEFGNRTAVRNVTGDFVEAGCWDSTMPFPIYEPAKRAEVAWVA